MNMSECIDIRLDSDTSLICLEAELSIAEFAIENSEDASAMEAFGKKKSSWWQTLKDRVKAFVKAVTDFAKNTLRSIKLFFVKQDIKKTETMAEKLNKVANSSVGKAAKKNAGKAVAVATPIVIGAVALSVVKKEAINPKSIANNVFDSLLSTFGGESGKEAAKLRRFAREEEEKAKRAIEENKSAASSGKSATEALSPNTIGLINMTIAEARKFLKLGTDALMKEANDLASSMEDVNRKISKAEHEANVRKVAVEFYDDCISIIRSRLKVIKSTLSTIKAQIT